MVEEEGAFYRRKEYVGFEPFRRQQFIAVMSLPNKEEGLITRVTPSKGFTIIPHRLVSKLLRKWHWVYRWSGSRARWLDWIGVTNEAVSNPDECCCWRFFSKAELVLGGKVEEMILNRVWGDVESNWVRRDDCFEAGSKRWRVSRNMW